MNLPRLAHPLPRSATGLINRLRALDVYPASAWSGVAGQRHADGELDLYPAFQRSHTGSPLQPAANGPVPSAGKSSVRKLTPMNKEKKSYARNHYQDLL
jgi:hypothetical protein